MTEKMIEQLLAALKPVIDAVECNDMDTVGQLSEDDMVLWLVENSWGFNKKITLGDLRKIRHLASEFTIDQEK